MFVRFRQTARRLQVSLVEPRRVNGKVRSEHVAGLGSVPLTPSLPDRVAFWTKLHLRLASLGNRIDDAQRQMIFVSVHPRIPAPTPDQMEAVARLGPRNRTKYDAMLAEIVRHGGGQLASNLCRKATKRAERQTIKLVWEYMQSLKRQQEMRAAQS